MDKNSRMKLPPITSKRDLGQSWQSSVRLLPEPPAASREPTVIGPYRSGTKTQLTTLSRSNCKVPLNLTSSMMVLPKLRDHIEEEAGHTGETQTNDVHSENNDEPHKDSEDVKNEFLILARQVTKQFTFADYTLSRDVTKTRSQLGIPDQRRLYAKCYEEACRRLRVPPVSRITRSLSEPSLTLRRYCLGDRGAQSLAVALLNNKHVMDLDLTDNWLAERATESIATMLKTNTHITHLNLSENRIGSDGCQAVCAAITTSPTILRLNLSHTGLRDIDSKHVRNMLMVNRTVKSLDISHNEFGTVGGIVLGNVLKFNDTLTELNVSWNHIRGKGALGLCLGLQENTGLASLDLSWNGFGEEGAKSLATVLRKNRTLNKLDVSCNRLNNDAMKHFIKGLMNNESLTCLKISNNSFATKIATALLTSIVESPNLPLRELHIQDIIVDEEFTDLLADIRRSYRNIWVTHGPVMRVNKGVKKGAGNPMSTNPLRVFFDHMNKKGMRVQDLYKRYDTGNRETFLITQQQFKDGIHSIQIPLNGGAMEQIIAKIKNRQGKPDLVKLMEEERKHRKKHLKVRLKQSKMRDTKEREDG